MYAQHWIEVIVNISCSVCTFNGGDIIEQKLGRFGFSLKNCKFSYTIAVAVMIPNLILDKSFP